MKKLQFDYDVLHAKNIKNWYRIEKMYSKIR